MAGSLAWNNKPIFLLHDKLLRMMDLEDIVRHVGVGVPHCSENLGKI